VNYESKKMLEEKTMKKEFPKNFWWGGCDIGTPNGRAL